MRAATRRMRSATKVMAKRRDHLPRRFLFFLRAGSPGAVDSAGDGAVAGWAAAGMRLIIAVANGAPEAIKMAARMPESPVTLESIRAARQRIGDVIYHSPCPYSLSLSRLCGCEVYCKLEHLQMTGSFKERGARNKLMLMTDAE